MDFFRNRERCAICKKGKTKDISGGDGSLLALPLGSKLTATQFASSGSFAVEIPVLPLPISFCGSRTGWEKLSQWYIHGYLTQQLWKWLN